MTHRPLTLLLLACLALLGVATPAFAHRLDEYLQAATIGVASTRIDVRLRLAPGVAVADAVLGDLDGDRDGVLSEAEQRAYVDRVRRDLSLSLDGVPLMLRATDATFAGLADMRDGLGDVVLSFEADAPAGGAARRLAFENRHQRERSVYLVNALVPSDPALRVTGQTRSYDQSSFTLDYAQSPTTRPTDAVAAEPWIDPTAGRSLFAAYAYAGVRHILTGYDHLLFLAALVLAARTAWELVSVVFTFTLAHTLTLCLAAYGAVHVPGRLVEPMIAASIVVVALQNVLWPRQTRGAARLAVAFGFGLFHGLGFAGGLLDAMRELPGGGTLLLAVAAFSVGVEVGHQLVALPLFAALRILRRTPSDAVGPAHAATRLQRLGSAGISAAGAYYLCVALVGVP